GADGVVFANATGGNTNFNASVVGTSSLTINAAGGGWVPNSGVSASTAAVTLNSGTILLIGNGNLGGGPITLTGGVLTSNNNTTFTFSNPLILGGVATLGDTGHTNTFAFTGSTTLTTNAVAVPINPVFLNGVVGEGGGPRALTVTGSTISTL